MFDESIKRIASVIRHLNKKSIELQESNWISANLSDITYTLSLAIQDLKRVDRVIKKREEENEK